MGDALRDSPARDGARLGQRNSNTTGEERTSYCQAYLYALPPPCPVGDTCRATCLSKDRAVGSIRTEACAKPQWPACRLRRCGCKRGQGALECAPCRAAAVRKA